MFEDALNELQKIDSVDCDHRSARLVRLSVYADQCNWALVTSAPKSPSVCAACGPARMRERSSTLMPASGCMSLP